MTEHTAPTSRLMADLQRLVNDAEALLRSTADGADESATNLRRRVQASLDDAQASLGELQEAALDKARAAARAADGYVHENPWSTIGAAAALGLLVGVLLGRR